MEAGADRDPLTSLALAAREGDTAAAAEFVRASQPAVWRLCALLGDPGETRDLAQETYLRAFRALPAYAGRSCARTWLLSIARRVCADAVRERRRRPRVDAAAELPDRPVPGTDLGEAVALRAAVRALGPDRREAFVLTQLVGLSYPEAAEVCGCPVGTIRSRVARARDDLIGGLAERRGSA
ncbi:MAG TPA: sigma-70 family RNA polymerase sigma factor [Mycobacteriales bacterium]